MRVRIINARSGRVLVVGDGVSYPGGEWFRLLDVRDESLWKVSALLEGNHLRPQRQWVPLTVRFMHPGFPFRRVAFIPS